MAIADKLTQLNNVKLAIKNALINKGVDMTGVAFTDYASKIDSLSNGITLMPYTDITTSFSSFFKSVLAYNFGNGGTYSPTCTFTSTKVKGLLFDYTLADSTTPTITVKGVREDGTEDTLTASTVDGYTIYKVNENYNYKGFKLTLKMYWTCGIYARVVI